jgi:hypothetical protein
MLIAIIELWLLILAENRCSCEFFLTNVELILAENVFAEIFRKIKCFFDFNFIINSLINKILGGFWELFFRDIYFSIFTAWNNVDLEFSNNFGVFSNDRNLCWIIHQIR